MLRDRYTCQICHGRRRARQLDVDHIVEIAAGGAALEYSNLQTVCRDCHRAKTLGFLHHRRTLDGISSSPDPGLHNAT
jgi:5-methylcytosine-specific restriction endonuclease McrA